MKTFGLLFNLYFISYYFRLDSIGGRDSKKCNYAWIQSLELSQTVDFNFLLAKNITLHSVSIHCLSQFIEDFLKFIYFRGHGGTEQKRDKQTRTEWVAHKCFDSTTLRS